MMFKLIISVCLSLISFSTQAFEFYTQKVTDNVYALVGDTGPRTAENFGSNNTVGFIITKTGVILVGTGAMPAGAKLIEQAIQKVTNKPIRWVINIGSQDHHWMGNSYFINQGIDVIALKRTIESQKEHVDDHLVRLQKTSTKLIKSVNPKYATTKINEDRKSLMVDDLKLELIWPGNGHFSGDAVLWLPNSKIVFTGDFVFLDRILGIHPFSQVKEWLKSTQEISKLKVKYVVPGHGNAAGWVKAQHETIAYLDMLVTGVTKAQDDWLELDQTIDKMANAPKFNHLKNYDSWHRRNIHRVFLQLEGN